MVKTRILESAEGTTLSSGEVSISCSRIGTRYCKYLCSYMTFRRMVQASYSWKTKFPIKIALGNLEQIWRRPTTWLPAIPRSLTKVAICKVKSKLGVFGYEVFHYQYVRYIVDCCYPDWKKSHHNSLQIPPMGRLRWRSSEATRCTFRSSPRPLKAATGCSDG